MELWVLGPATYGADRPVAWILGFSGAFEGLYLKSRGWLLDGLWRALEIVGYEAEDIEVIIALLFLRECDV